MQCLSPGIQNPNLNLDLDLNISITLWLISKKVHSLNIFSMANFVLLSVLDEHFTLLSYC